MPQRSLSPLWTALAVTAAFLAAFLAAAYGWRLERAIEGLRARTARGGPEPVTRADLERLAARVAGLEAAATPASSPPTGASVSTATSEAPGGGEPAETAPERPPPKGWRSEAEALWAAVARLENRALEEDGLVVVGDEVDLEPLLAAGELVPVSTATTDAAAWSGEQIIGPPNTPECGDSGSAWASLAQNGPAEWIEVDFDRPRVPRAVIVRETFNPGAVVRVEGDAGGNWVALWEGQAPARKCPAHLVIGVGSRAFALRTLRVSLDCSKVSGWNEIDAIGVLDESGIAWAAAVRVSSTYAERAAQ